MKDEETKKEGSKFEMNLENMKLKAESEADQKMWSKIEGKLDMESMARNKGYYKSLLKD